MDRVSHRLLYTIVRPGHDPLQLAIDRYPEAGDTDWAQKRKTERRSVVNLLLAAGADVEVRGSDGNRPLHTVALFGQIDLVELLITHGAEINARNDWGWTPLRFAVDHDQADVVDALVKHGAH